MADKEITSRACGAVHPDGVVCSLTVLVENGCCTERVYEHDDPHERWDESGTVTHRWEAVLVVKDLPYDAYSPHKGEKKHDETQERTREWKKTA